jgi:hypothetical protein
MPIHGGMSYVKFGEIVIATSGRPTRGPWMRVVERVRREIPSAAIAWVPQSLNFIVFKEQYPLETIEWPFGAALPLSEGMHSTSDRDAVAFLMKRSFGRNAFRETFTQNGAAFRAYVLSVSGWMDDPLLAILVEGLRADR